MLELCTLVGKGVRLEPLNLEHFEDLTAHIEDAEMWRYMAFGSLDTRQKLFDWIGASVAEAEQGVVLPLAVVEIASGLAVGSTSLYDYSPIHRHLEIGRTWLGARVRRTAVNTECKFLLLQHAFETLECLRVQLKTDGRNLRSQAAIERLGAQKEGVLRRHLVLPDGFVRDTVVYSILDSEWDRVKQRLAGGAGYRGEDI